MTQNKVHLAQAKQSQSLGIRQGLFILDKITNDPPTSVDYQP